MSTSTICCCKSGCKPRQTFCFLCFMVSVDTSLCMPEMPCIDLPSEAVDGTNTMYMYIIQCLLGTKDVVPNRLSGRPIRMQQWND